MYESSIFTNLELFLWLNPQCRLILTLTLLKWTLQITLGGSNLIISIIFFLIYCILVIYFDGCIYRRQNGQLIWVSSHIYPLIDSYSTRLAHFFTLSCIYSELGLEGFTDEYICSVEGALPCLWCISNWHTFTHITFKFDNSMSWMQRYWFSVSKPIMS